MANEKCKPEGCEIQYLASSSDWTRYIDYLLLFVSYTLPCPGGSRLPGTYKSRAPS